MAKIISEVKLLALLYEAYDGGRKSGKLDEYSKAFDQDADAKEKTHREDLCLALVERASIQEVKQ